MSVIRMTFPETVVSNNPSRSSSTSKRTDKKTVKNDELIATAQRVVNASNTFWTEGKPRRTSIPARPKQNANLWSIMKNCIGKDLSKIPVPVNFSEPLSMLQRLAEDFEYSELLDQAAGLPVEEQCTFVAAFTVSSYSTTAFRTNKPFNPLLGETFEFDRMKDLGRRLISEQVSHHPPIAAQYCEGAKWKVWQEFTMVSKFRGKYLKISPVGVVHLLFDSGNHYTWNKVETTINNIIFGKLWIDNCGTAEIVEHKTGTRCSMEYVAYSYYHKEMQRRVRGKVEDKKHRVSWLLEGAWDMKLEAFPAVPSDTDPRGYQEGPSRTLWTVTPLPPNADKFYNFSYLACQLNEKERGTAPTDSRLRPDQRLMEIGDWDSANEVKLILEEKQRTSRKDRDSKKDSYNPLWFKPEKDQQAGGTIHIYKGGYWEAKKNKDWSKCPNIFL